MSINDPTIVEVEQPKTSDYLREDLFQIRWGDKDPANRKTRRKSQICGRLHRATDPDRLISAACRSTLCWCNVSSSFRRCGFDKATRRRTRCSALQNRNRPPLCPSVSIRLVATGKVS